jgi:hypothetical protein
VRFNDQYSQTDRAAAQTTIPTEEAASGEASSLCAEQSGWYARVSTDGGLTWDKHRMFASGEPGCKALTSGWQSLDVDAHGTAYVVWG